jgi:hypothetical protein
MKMAIAEGLMKGHTYTKYRALVTGLLAQGKSSGSEQSEKLTHYSALNEVRMDRLDKKMVISEDNIQKLIALKKDYVWLVLSEGWCGDAAQLLPVFNKMAVLSEHIELKILFRDENDKLMHMFLTNGARSIPKLIIVDKKTGEVAGDWGPRPKGASDLIKSYRQQYGAIDETAKTELQLWYLHDKGLSTQNEILEKMLLLDN